MFPRIQRMFVAPVLTRKPTHFFAFKKCLKRSYSFQAEPLPGKQSKRNEIQNIKEFFSIKEKMTEGRIDCLKQRLPQRASVIIHSLHSYTVQYLQHLLVVILGFMSVS